MQDMYLDVVRKVSKAAKGRGEVFDGPSQCTVAKLEKIDECEQHEELGPTE